MAVETEGVVTGEEQGPQKGGQVRCLGAIRTERESAEPIRQDHVAQHAAPTAGIERRDISPEETLLGSCVRSHESNGVGAWHSELAPMESDSPSVPRRAPMR